MDYTGLDELQLKKLCTRWANEKFFELTQGGPRPVCNRSLRSLGRLHATVGFDCSTAHTSYQLISAH